LASRGGNSSTTSGDNLTTTAEKATLIQELTDIKNNLDRSMKQYEKTFGEVFQPTNTITSTTGMTASDMLGSSTLGLNPLRKS